MFWWVVTPILAFYLKMSTGVPIDRISHHWVPLAFRSLAMGTYGLSYGEIRHPASCPLAAGQARALAGWPRACIQSVSDLCMMHA